MAPEYSIADEQAVSDERMLKYSATMEMPVTSTDSSVSDRWSVSMNSTETAVIDARMENNEVWLMTINSVRLLTVSSKIFQKGQNQPNRQLR